MIGSRTRAAFLLIGLLTTASFPAYGDEVKAPAPRWKVDLGEPVQSYRFIQDGKALFFTSGKKVWLYDTASGANVWTKEIKGYEKKGMHELVGERYLVSAGDKLQAYDAATGNLAWEKEYPKVDQDEFRSFEMVNGNAVIAFAETHLGIDLATGNELWRAKIKYNGKLSPNYSVLDKVDRMVVMTPGDEVLVFNTKTGAQVGKIEDYEVNAEFSKNKLPFFRVADDEKHAVLILDNGAALIDTVEGKELARKKFSMKDDKPALLDTQVGVAVLGKDKIVHFNFATGAAAELKFPVGDIRTFKGVSAGGKALLLVSAENRLSAIDLGEGKILWQSAEDDKNFAGYAHRFFKQDGNQAILTYSDEGSGSPLSVMSLDVLTGTVAYKTKVGLAKHGISNFGRGALNLLAGVMDATLGQLAKPTKNPMHKNLNAIEPEADVASAFNHGMGYDNIGFDYKVSEWKGNLLFSLIGKSDMLNPETKEEGGHGFVLVNPKDGKVVYKDYFVLFDDGKPANAPEPGLQGEPLLVDNVIYLPGTNRVIAFDLDAGKRLWTVGPKELKGYPDTLALIDGMVGVKFGHRKFIPKLDKTTVKVHEAYDENPYGIAAIDAKEGKLLWRVELKQDPAFLTSDFSLEKYYNAAAKQLYVADEEKIYALQFRKDGGKFDWTADLDEAGLGSMKFKKIYAVTDHWIGTERKTSSYTTHVGGGYTITNTSTTGGLSDKALKGFQEDFETAEIATTYTSWGNVYAVTASRALRLNYNGDSLLVFGTDGIGMIGAADGKVRWKHKWDYDHEAVQYLPHVLADRIVYCVDRKIASVDVTTGKTLWTNKEAKKPRFFEAPDGSSVFSVDDETVTAYSVK